MSAQTDPARAASRAEIVDAIGSLCAFADAREWDALAGIFTDEVSLDYTSLFGGAAERVPSRAMVDGWAAFFARFAATQHLIGLALIEIDGDRATARAPVIAHHFVGDALHGPAERWVIGGHYAMALERSGGRWRIAGLTLHAIWQDGRPPA